MVVAIKLMLMAAAFLMPFLPDMAGLLMMYSLVAVYLVNDIMNDHNEISKSNMDIPVILYLIIILISTLTSISLIGSLRDLGLHLGGLSFVFVMVNSIKSKNVFNALVTVLVFSATVVALYGLYQYVVGVEIDDAWLDVENNPDVRVRVYSVFHNPNILAEYLIMIIPLSVSLFWYTKKISKKIVFLGTTLIMILAMLMTLSRGSWVGFAFSAFVFILLLEKRLLLLVVPISLGAVYFLPQSILNRIMSIGNFADSSIAYRFTMWEITMDIIRDYPIAGVGFGHLPFKQIFETYIRTMPIYHSHNTYLQTAVEMGIPGLLAFLFLLFILFKYGILKLVKSEDRYIRILSAGALSSLGGVLTHGMAENVLYLPRIIFTFWIVVGLILTLDRIRRYEV
ncbi:polymerase [Tissierella creatinini]|nr:polymerase [Tissierella creatinini]TJX67407.1 polymerase [Soehngenia saccharolytica]